MICMLTAFLICGGGKEEPVLKKLSVCVLFGGVSSEHEVSLRSAESVLNRLDKDKYHIFPVGITKDGDWILFGGKDYGMLPAGTWQNCEENRRAALQIRRECGVLSAEDERRETAFLTRVDAALAARSDAEAFEAVRLLAETSGTAAEQSRQNTLAALENGLRFIHETFGKEQELWILLHGLRECGAAAFLQKENSAVYRELLSNASPEARAAALREELKR